MCSYREKKHDPTEMMQLEGFTVDYCEPLQGKNNIDRHSILCTILKSLYVQNFFCSFTYELKKNAEFTL